MIDKADVKVPYSASFRPEFRFLRGEMRYAGTSSAVRRSQHYQGVVDLRCFHLDAILHAYFRHQGRQNHKLELIDTGEKSLDEMARIISTVFAVDPKNLEMMRVDFAADLPGVPVVHLYGSLRVKQKRSTDAIGELEYEVIGGHRLEYFRYGKSPNCVRVYDKVAESKARLPQILKRVSRDAEQPTFEDVFGFPPDATLTRVERQAGGGRLPEQVSTFGDLRNAGDFDPFGNVEVLRNDFPLPDPQRVGPSRALKLIGTNEYIKRLGYQQARAALNCDRNAKRYFDDLDAYHAEMETSIDVTIHTIRESYRKSVQAQIEGSVEAHQKTPSKSNCEREFSTSEHRLTVPRG